MRQTGIPVRWTPLLLGVIFLAGMAVVVLLGAQVGSADVKAPSAPIAVPTSVTINAVADAYVDEAALGSNYGAYKSLFVALEGSSGSEQETLAGFNLSSIPAGWWWIRRSSAPIWSTPAA